MRARTVPLAIVLLAAAAHAVAAGTAPDPPVSVEPNPPRAGESFLVRVAHAADGVAAASVKVCRAEAGRAVLCALPVAMTADGADLVATSDGAVLAPGGEFGVNVTLHRADGTRVHIPSGAADPDRAYVFFVAAEERATPVPSLALALALALALPVVAWRRRS